MTSAQKAFNIVAMIDPYTAIIMGISLIIIGVVEIIAHWKRMGHIVRSIWNNIKIGAFELFNFFNVSLILLEFWFKKHFRPLYDVMELIRTVDFDIWKTEIKIIETAFKGVLDVVTQIFDLITHPIKTTEGWFGDLIKGFESVASSASGYAGGVALPNYATVGNVQNNTTSNSSSPTFVSNVTVNGGSDNAVQTGKTVSSAVDKTHTNMANKVRGGLR